MVCSTASYLYDVLTGLHGEEMRQWLFNEFLRFQEQHSQEVPNVYLQQIGVRPCNFCNHEPDENGYPTFRIPGMKDKFFVHHLVWMVYAIHTPDFPLPTNGEGGLDVDELKYSHRCMNPECTEPTHGEWVPSIVDVRRKQCRSAAYVVTDPVLSESYIHKLCPCNPPCLTIKVLGQHTRDAWIEGEQQHLAARGTYPVDATTGQAIRNLRKDGAEREVPSNKGLLNQLVNGRQFLLQSLCHRCERESVVDEESLLPGLGVPGLGPCSISTMPIPAGRDRSRMKTRTVDGNEHFFKPWHVCWIARYGHFPEHLEYDHWCHNGNCIKPNHGRPN